MRSGRRTLCVAVVLLATSAVVLVLGGVVTIWDSDAGQDVFVLRVDPSAAFVFVAGALALVAGVVAFWWRPALWVVVVAATASAVWALAVRGSVMSAAADVNDYVQVEGGTGGISNPITRATNGAITAVDPDVVDSCWLIGAVLLVVAAALAAGDLWLTSPRRTRS